MGDRLRTKLKEAKRLNIPYEEAKAIGRTQSDGKFVYRWLTVPVIGMSMINKWDRFQVENIGPFSRGVGQ